MRFSCHWQEIEYIIATWLEKNHFTYVEKENKKYYVMGNPLTRRFFFEYSYFFNNDYNRFLGLYDMNWEADIEKSLEIKHCMVCL